MITSKIRIEEMAVGVSCITMRLTPHTEECFKRDVFPYLFDGQTSGSCKRGKNRVKWTLLVYDQTLVNVFRQVLVNEIMKANGQLN